MNLLVKLVSSKSLNGFRGICTSGSRTAGPHRKLGQDLPLVSSDGRDHYDVLGISPDSTETEVREAFFRKAKEFHPDINPDPKAKEEFLRIRESYRVLNNSVHRQSYNRQMFSTYRAVRKLDPEEEDRREKQILKDTEVFMETKKKLRGRPLKWHEYYYSKDNKSSNIRLYRDVQRKLFRELESEPTPQVTILKEKAAENVNNLLFKKDPDLESAKRQGSIIGGLVIVTTIAFFLVSRIEKKSSNS